MGAIMTMAIYLLAELDMFDGFNHFDIYVRDIISIEVFERYVLFKMRNGEEIHQKHNIGYYLDKLSCTHFGKYSKSVILNKHCVESIEGGSELIAFMINGDGYEVSEDNNVRVRQDMKPIFAARLRKLKLIILSFIS
jgi:hypothetical protein